MALRFIVRPAKGGAALAKGVIKNKIGDFSSFNPEGDAEYVVEAGGITSVPFRVGPFWLERISYQDAVDFMIDSRHYVGNDRDGLPRLVRLARRPPLRLGTPHAGPAASIKPLRLRAHATPGEIRKTQGQGTLGRSRTLPGQRPGHRETHPLGSRCHRHPEARPRASQGPARLLPLCMARPGSLPAQAELRDRPRLCLQNLGRPEKRPQISLRRKPGTQPARPQNQNRLHQGLAASRFLRRTEPPDVRGRQTRETPRRANSISMPPSNRPSGWSRSSIGTIRSSPRASA